MITQRLFNKMRAALADGEAEPVGITIPWDLIVDAIKSLLEGCSNRPADAAALKAAPIGEDDEDGRWLRHSIRQALDSAGVRPTRARVNAAVARVTKARAEAAEADLQELLDCCFAWEF